MHTILVLLPFILSFFSCEQKQDQRILVFSKTEKFRHTSIPAAKLAILKLGLDNHFKVETTENADLFNEASLEKYAAVVFLHTTGNVLNDKQELAFKKFIQAGGGYAGIHAAADTEYDWEWYGKLAGAYFQNHPEIQAATLNIIDNAHVSTQHLSAKWNRTDEWYNFKNLNPDVKIIMTIDEASYTGGTMNNNHPMSWYHAFDGGRSFYTALGHTEASWSETLFLQHVLGGIKYAMGESK